MNPVPMIPSVGRIVHYVMPDGQHRPAIIVRVWHHPSEAATPESLVNVQVLTDGSNDDPQRDPNAPLILWLTSIAQQPEGTTPNTWHAPETAPPVLARVPDSFVSVPWAKLDEMRGAALMLCYQIEGLAAGPVATQASVMASAIHQELQRLVSGR